MKTSTIVRCDFKQSCTTPASIGRAGTRRTSACGRSRLGRSRISRRSRRIPPRSWIGRSSGSKCKRAYEEGTSCATTRPHPLLWVSSHSQPRRRRRQLLHRRSRCLISALARSRRLRRRTRRAWNYAATSGPVSGPGIDTPVISLVSE